MSLTRYSPVVALPPTTAPDYIGGEVIVYVPSTGKVWQSLVEWYGTKPASFAIVETSGWTLDTTTDDSSRSYGDVYAAEYNANLDCVFAATNFPTKVVRFESDGTFSWAISGGAFASDPVSGRLFLFTFGSSLTITEIDPADGSSLGTVYTQTGAATGAATPIISTAGGVLWWIADYGSTYGRVYRVDMSDWSDSAIYDGASADDAPSQLFYRESTNTLYVQLAGNDPSSPYGARVTVLDADAGTEVIAPTVLAYQQVYAPAGLVSVDETRGVLWARGYDTTTAEYHVVGYDLDTLSATYDEQYVTSTNYHWFAVGPTWVAVVGYEDYAFYDTVAEADDSFDLYAILVMTFAAPPSGGVRRQLYLP